MVISAFSHPEEHFSEYVERHLRKSPEMIKEIEKILSKLKSNDSQK